MAMMRELSALQLSPWRRRGDISTSEHTKVPSCRTRVSTCNMVAASLVKVSMVLFFLCEVAEGAPRRYPRRDVLSLVAARRVETGACRALCLRDHSKSVNDSNSDCTLGECAVCWDGCSTFYLGSAADRDRSEAACRSPAAAAFRPGHLTACSHLTRDLSRKGKSENEVTSSSTVTRGHWSSFESPRLEGCVLRWDPSGEKKPSNNVLFEDGEVGDDGEEMDLIYDVFAEDKSGVFHALGQTLKQRMVMDAQMLPAYVRIRILAISPFGVARQMASSVYPGQCLDDPDASANLDSSSSSLSMVTMNRAGVIIALGVGAVVLATLALVFFVPKCKSRVARDKEELSNNADSADSANNSEAELTMVSSSEESGYVAWEIFEKGSPAYDVFS